MNVVCLVGRIVRDPEVRVTQKGDDVCSFSLAVGRNYKNSKGEYDTDYFDCVAYRSTANYIGKYCRKGNILEIAGKLKQNKYEHDGVKRYSVEVIAENVRNLSPKKSGAETSGDDFDEIEPLDDVSF